MTSSGFDPAARVREANDALINERDPSRVGEFFAPGYVAHVTGPNFEGPQAVARFVSAYLGAFSDVRVEVEILVAEGDRVAWRRSARGTFDGSFMGMEGDGRSRVWHDVIVTRFDADGAIVEEWGESGLGGALANG